MACSAEIIAIGPFARKLIPALGYGADQYRDVADGTTVIACVFGECGGSNESEKLAECFGVGRWDLGRHVLDASKANLEMLRHNFDLDCTENFVALREAGFQFYYMPNG